MTIVLHQRFSQRYALSIDDYWLDLEMFVQLIQSIPAHVSQLGGGPRRTTGGTGDPRACPRCGPMAAEIEDLPDPGHRAESSFPSPLLPRGS